MLHALTFMNLDTLDHLDAVLDRVLGTDSADPYRAAALKEHLDRVREQGMRFVVYGHTHDPVQAALSADGNTQDTYLNSGTFRQRVFRTEDRQGFISSEHMTYLCFFREDEAATWRDPAEKLAGPAFAAWRGARSR